MGEGIFQLPLSFCGIPQMGQKQLFCSHTHPPSSPAPSPTGLPLVCCLGKLPYLQLVGARASSHTLIVPGPALSSATAARREGKEEFFFFSLPMSPHGRHKREGSVFLLSSTPIPFQGGTVEQGQGYSSLVLQPVWGRANSVSPDPHRSSDNRSQGHLHRLTILQGLRFRHDL